MILVVSRTLSIVVGMLPHAALCRHLVRDFGPLDPYLSAMALLLTTTRTTTTRTTIRGRRRAR